jgi:hypothetical protein
MSAVVFTNVKFSAFTIKSHLGIDKNVHLCYIEISES